jgi:hypothetical protein
VKTKQLRDGIELRNSAQNLNNYSKTKDLKGKTFVGQAKVDFLETRYKEKQKIKKFNFGQFTSGITYNESDNQKSTSKFDLKNINFSGTPNNPNDTNPIQNDTTDFKFDNDDAILNMNSTNNN